MLPVLSQKELIEERKTKAVESLSSCYAINRLPLEEYERLVEYINKIESERELVIIEKIVSEYTGNMPSGTAENSDEPEYSGGFSPNFGVAVLSNRHISGPLKSGSQLFSFLGSCRIEIRKSDLSKQRTQLNITSILGDCKIYVEQGIKVVNNLFPILSNSDVDRNIKQSKIPGAPELIISGLVLLGDVSVKPLN